MTESLTPSELVAALGDGVELALLDAREEGEFCDRHLFHAGCCPLSRLELELPSLVPRRSTRLVWCSGADDGLAARAAARSQELGWADSRVLEGGLEAWQANGGELYGGVNVPSKAFGEHIEHVHDTPRITAEDLDAMLASDDPPVVLDSRPVGEFRRMSIPTGIDCPGAELVHRIRSAVPDSSKTVVVNCAGRTRSIIGAQSLINAGVPNSVVALENGTMGWELAGFTVARGASGFAPEPDHAARRWAIDAAQAVATRFGVADIDAATLEGWLSDHDRTTYLFDVRTPQEYRDGHRPGFRHAEGGQLVQATDAYVATRGGRIVITDDDGVRAMMTASWLRQLGWLDTWVLPGTAWLGGDLERGPEPPSALVPADPLQPISVQEAHTRLTRQPGPLVLDTSTSLQFRDRGHVPGARWVVRSRLDAVGTALAGRTEVVVIGHDPLLADWTAVDLRDRHPELTVRTVSGGMRAWVEAGLPVEFGMTGATVQVTDVWYKPYDFEDPVEVEREMRRYLTWEIALVEQLASDPTVSFPTF